MRNVIRKLLPARAITGGLARGPGRLIETVAPAKDPRRRVRLIITATTPDRDGELVVASGARVEAFVANPVVLFSHGMDPVAGMLPIANATELVLRDDEIEAEVEFFTPKENPLSEQLFQLYSRGKMKAASIGFLPIKVTDEKIVEGQRGRAFLEWELLEFSLVSIPSLPGALSISEREAALAHAKAFAGFPGWSWEPATLSPMAAVRRSLCDLEAQLARLQMRGTCEEIGAIDLGVRLALSQVVLEEQLERQQDLAPLDRLEHLLSKLAEDA